MENVLVEKCSQTGLTRVELFDKGLFGGYYEFDEEDYYYVNPKMIEKGIYIKIRLIRDIDGTLYECIFVNVASGMEVMEVNFYEGKELQQAKHIRLLKHIVNGLNICNYDRDRFLKLASFVKAISSNLDSPQEDAIAIEKRFSETVKYRVETQAQAQAERVRLDGIAKADAERAQGTAEAEIIRLRGLAEAEAKEKIAEAFEQYGQAAILDMVVRMLPEYAKQVASPLSNIDKITVVDTGGGANGGAGKVTSYATDLMSSLQATLKESSGIDVKKLIESYVEKK